MTVYRVTGFEANSAALVEARSSYDAKRYIYEDILDNEGSIDRLDVEKVFSGIHIERHPAR